MPTFSPKSRRPSARLTATVDLPTPPLPEATAMIAATPGMPAGPLVRAQVLMQVLMPVLAPFPRGLGPHPEPLAGGAAVRQRRRRCVRR